MEGRGTRGSSVTRGGKGTWEIGDLWRVEGEVGDTRKVG